MAHRTDTLELELQQKRAKQAAIEEALREAEKMDAKILSDQEDSHTLLPPFEEITERKNQYKFDAQISRHVAENQRRTLSYNTFLNLLLLLAMLACLWWAYQMLQHLWTAP